MGIIREGLLILPLRQGPLRPPALEPVADQKEEACQKPEGKEAGDDGDPAVPLFQFRLPLPFQIPQS